MALRFVVNRLTTIHTDILVADTTTKPISVTSEPGTTIPRQVISVHVIRSGSSMGCRYIGGILGLEGWIHLV